jgi:hypothetical protein
MNKLVNKVVCNHMSRNSRFYTNVKVIENLKKYNSNLKFHENVLTACGSLVGFPFGFTSVSQNTVKIIFRFGKYDNYLKEGLSWRPPFCEEKQVFCGDKTLNFDNLNLTDYNGNPLNISSCVIYNVIDPLNFIVNVQKEQVLINFIENNFRQYLTKYSYNELTSNKNILNEFVRELNKDQNTILYGIEIQSAGILQINYAKEIAETMLVKQKINATIEARKEIIDSTLSMINDITTKLDNNLTKEDKSKLITCLTVSLITSNSPTNVINLN